MKKYSRPSRLSVSDTQPYNFYFAFTLAAVFDGGHNRSRKLKIKMHPLHTYVDTQTTQMSLRTVTNMYPSHADDAHERKDARNIPTRRTPDGINFHVGNIKAIN